YDEDNLIDDMDSDNTGSNDSNSINNDSFDNYFLQYHMESLESGIQRLNFRDRWSVDNAGYGSLLFDIRSNHGSDQDLIYYKYDKLGTNSLSTF
ncbi:214_t:CDS:2, partial [Gigaspora rosea]